MPVVQRDGTASDREFWVWFNLPNQTDRWGRKIQDHKRNVLALVEHETKTLLWNVWHLDPSGNQRFASVPGMSAEEINELIKIVAGFIQSKGLYQEPGEELLDLLYAELGEVML